MRQQGYLNLSPRTQRIAFNGPIRDAGIGAVCMGGDASSHSGIATWSKVRAVQFGDHVRCRDGGTWPGIVYCNFKGLFAGITRGFVAMLMSLSGGVASTLVMWFFLRLKGNPFGMIGLGVAGALSHNAAQLCGGVAYNACNRLVYSMVAFIWCVCSGILTGLVLHCSDAVTR